MKKRDSFRRHKLSYKEKVMDIDSDAVMDGDDLDLEGDVLEDDESDRDEEGLWFSMGMTKE